jgi:hypothetical protein
MGVDQRSFSVLQRCAVKLPESGGFPGNSS